jgi:3-hydroxyisobutyrate dehydrogenase
MMAKTIGYIGMGIMGVPMSRNLLKAGFQVSVYNRTKAKAEPLVKEGATAYDSPADLAGNVDVVFTNVTDTPDVRAVLLGPGGVVESAREGLTVVDNSTISPNETAEMAAELKKKGVRYLDAPVSGGDIGAQQGTLTIMCGGEQGVFDDVKPMLEAMGKRVTLMGPVGMGQMTKLCNQIMCAVNMVACCEAISLAKKAGLDVHTMLDVVTAGAGGSWALSNLGPKIADGDMAPGFMVKLILKDLNLVEEASRSAELPIPGTVLATELFRASQANGGGGLGTQAMAQVFEKLGAFQIAG